MRTRRRALPTGWYPATARECEFEIRNFVNGFTPPDGNWVSGVAPHAGWYFSGKPAARVLKTLASVRKPDVTVVFGGHLSSGHRPVVYIEDSWETPFGNLSMDSGLSMEIVSTTGAFEAPEAFADNTVEIQLPFVKWFFPKSILIAAHSPASMEAASFATKLSELLISRKLSAVFLGSADLTHYGSNDGFSPKGSGSTAVEWVKSVNDKSLVDKALKYDAQGILDDANRLKNTCSPGPIVSAMTCALINGSRQSHLIDYYTSHDIMPGTSFVGYAAIVY